MVNKELIYKKLKELDRNLKVLKKYQGITVEELDNDLEKLWIIERGLQVCIQNLLDLGNHILAEIGISVDNYGDIFKELGKKGIIPEEFAKEIAKSAGLRNAIVHEYSGLKEDALYEVMGEVIEQYAQYCKYVLHFLEKK